MANFMKFHLLILRISYHIFFLAEMTHKELLAFFASGAKGGVKGKNYESQGTIQVLRKGNKGGRGGRKILTLLNKRM